MYDCMQQYIYIMLYFILYVLYVHYIYVHYKISQYILTDRTLFMLKINFNKYSLMKFLYFQEEQHMYGYV